MTAVTSLMMVVSDDIVVYLAFQPTFDELYVYTTVQEKRLYFGAVSHPIDI